MSKRFMRMYSIYLTICILYVIFFCSNYLSILQYNYNILFLNKRYQSNIYYSLYNINATFIIYFSANLDLFIVFLDPSLCIGQIRPSYSFNSGFPFAH